jgi:hypothetical protein
MILSLILTKPVLVVEIAARWLMLLCYALPFTEQMSCIILVNLKLGARA